LGEDLLDEFSRSSCMSRKVDEMKTRISRWRGWSALGMTVGSTIASESLSFRDCCGIEKS